jgi:hypothetical protein
MSDNEPDFSPKAIKIDDEVLYSRPVEWSDDTHEKVTKYELVCPRCSQMIHARPNDLDLTDDAGQLYQNGDDNHILMSQCADGRGDCPMLSVLVTMETAEPAQEEPEMDDKLRKRAERRAKMQQVKSNPPPESKQAPVPQTKSPARNAASADIDVNIDGKDLSANKVDKDKRAKAPPVQPNMEACPFADPTATGELIVMDDRPDEPEVVTEEIPDEQ